MQVEDAGIDKTGYFRLKTHFCPKSDYNTIIWANFVEANKFKDDKIFRIRIARPP